MDLNYYCEISVRLNATLRAVKLTPLRWVVLSNFLLDTRPVSESALAMICDVPRSTIRPHVQELLRVKILARDPDGMLVLTDGMHEKLELFAHETVAIAHGTRKGYGPRMIEILVEMHRETPWKERQPLDPENLANIYFTPVLKGGQIRHT